MRRPVEANLSQYGKHPGKHKMNQYEVAFDVWLAALEKYEAALARYDLLIPEEGDEAHAPFENTLTARRASLSFENLKAFYRMKVRGMEDNVAKISAFEPGDGRSAEPAKTQLLADFQPVLDEMKAALALVEALPPPRPPDGGIRIAA
jgi:hypothetical protein